MHRANRALGRTRHRPRRRAALVGLGLLLLLMVALPPISAGPRPDGPAAAWQRAREAGHYAFSADIEQTVVPQATVLNVGRTSKQEVVHLEGQADLPARYLHLTLWSDSGTVLDPTTGTEVRVEGDRAYARRGPQAWQEIDNFAGLFAPQGDLMAFLAAARDVVDHGRESRKGLTFSRYTFRIDGHSYATYLRQQLEATLVERGELPPGVSLETPREYAQITGEGELWVDEAGLPLRQILRLRLPPRPDEQQVEAEITVDFDFAIPDRLATALGRDLAGSALSPASWGFGLALLPLVLVVVATVHHRSKKVYAALALLLLATMLLTPLLQTAQAAAFADRQAQREAEQEQRQQGSEMERDLRAFLEEPTVDPHRDPLAAAGPDQPIVVAGGDGGGSGDTTECDPDKPGDPDGDGLTNGNECVLGTDPEAEDTDGDGVPDGAEVEGFTYDDVTWWYTDPLESDTNRDGFDDGREWETGRPSESAPPPDSDGDGTPDLFDWDNDGDGVPDSLDLSPYYVGESVFDDADPFQLVLDQLIAGQPTFVEFQLRPSDPEHLWFAFNVLDWPEGDNQGQMQDADGKTFFDVDDSTARSPNDNGDVKVVPMLEITIEGNPDNLPPAETCADDEGEAYTCYPDLEHYGIAVQELNDAGTDKAVYVPLQIVTDSKTGERVAFSSRMYYRPDVQWGKAHQVRLVWAVQALVDKCDIYEDGRCVAYEEMNVSQILHVYEDAWTLTGLHVREEHGTGYDVILEDPAVDDDVEDDATLYFLTYGLDRTFLSGSDCEDVDVGDPDDPEDDVCLSGDGVRDIDLAEIARRFDHTRNDGYTVTETWKLSDTMRVYTYTYDTWDEAATTLATTETTELLNAHFSGTGATPTLLFVREENFRSLNMDESIGDTGTIRWSEENPHQLTLVLSRSEVPTLTMAGLNWAPYRFQDGEWQSYPIEDYWQELDDRYGLDFADEYAGEEDPEEVRAGGVFVGQVYYLTLYKGMSAIVEEDGVPLSQDYQTYDKPLWATFARIGTISIVTMIDKIVMHGFENSVKALRFLNLLHQSVQAEGKESIRSTLNTIKHYFNKFRGWWRSSGVEARALTIVGVLLGLLLVVTLTLFIASGWGNFYAKATAAAVIGVLMFALQIVVPALQIRAMIGLLYESGMGAWKATGKVLSMSSEYLGASRKMAIVGLILSIGIVWGIFGYVLATTDISAGSVAFDMLLAQTIAATIVTLVYFALSLTIVGAIIVALISIVDIVLALLLPEDKAWTITGFFTQAVTKLIFAYELAVVTDEDELYRMGADDLVQMGELALSIVDPGIGMVAGNEIELSTVITTSLVHRDPEDPRAVLYLWYYDQEQLESTAFDYVLAETPRNLSADLGDDGGRWHTSERADDFLGHTMYQAYKSDDLALRSTLEAGVNQEVKIYLSSAYAFPGVECWSFLWFAPPIPVIVCVEKGIDGTVPADMAEAGNAIVLDVFPPTLDGFMQTEAWAGDLLLRDADGDGLLGRDYNGGDPDDATWDADGDGLSDAWEMGKSSLPANQGGQFFDPLLPDTDSDGLSDLEEARLGTNPMHTDSDGDGIPDYSEVRDGWSFTYAEGKTTRVYSSPLERDWDLDGMDDLFERTLHTCPDCDPLENRYHPYVWNKSPIGLGTVVGDEDMILPTGQSFIYTTTVRNNVQPDLWVRGTTELSADPLTGGPLEMYFDIARAHSQTLIADLSVPGGTGSRDVDMDTTMQAHLHTPSDWAWDPRQQSSHPAATGGIPKAVAVAAVDDWTVPYVSAVLENDRVYVYPTTADGISGAGVHAIGWGDDRSNAAPDVACNEHGTCLVVWSSYYPTGDDHYFRWRRVLPTLHITGTVRTITAPAGEETAGGAIASDGTNFLALWMEGTPGSYDLHAYRVNAYGDTMGDRLTLDSGDIESAAVTWAFDRYVVVWSRGGNLYGAHVQGETISTFSVSDVDYDQARPRIAYDPLGRRSLVLYHHQSPGNGKLHARILNGRQVGEAFQVAPFYYANHTDEVDFAVSADPSNGGWIVGWTQVGNSFIRYRGIGMAGEMRGDREYVLAGGTPTNTLDLACTEARPSCWLRLEEGEGADEFADSSGFGHEGTCSGSGCPLSGVEGRYGNAVRFDGSNDTVFVMLNPSEEAYAVSFWFKTSRQNAGLFAATNDYPTGDARYRSDRLIYFDNGRLCAVLGNYRDERETICTSGKGYADDQWHHLVHTYGGAVGGQRLYVDGEVVASGEWSSSPLSECDRLRIGSAKWGCYSCPVRRIEGVMDEVKVYPRALSAGEVRDAYRAALLVYAFDEPEGATWFENSARNGYGAECGDDCPVAGGAGRAYAAAEFDGNYDALLVENQENDLIHYFYDFTVDPPPYSFYDPNWDHENLDEAPEDSGRHYLVQSLDADHNIIYSLSDLPAHDRVEMAFEVFIYDQKINEEWDNEDWEWWIDGERFVRMPFPGNPYTPVEVDTLGFYGLDEVYTFERTFDHTADTLVSEFKDIGREPCGAEECERWGLDRVDVRISSRNVPLAESSFTVAFWAQREQADRNGYVLSQGVNEPNQDLFIGWWADNRAICAFDDDGNALVTTDAYPDTGWHHWACTYDVDTGQRTLYYDGQQVAQDTAPAPYQGSGELRIGRARWGNYFLGRLDELAVWRDAFSADEIETLYNKVKALDDSVSECALARAMQDDSGIYVNRAALRETTALKGQVEQQNTDVITVDASRPDSTITSLAEGERLAVTGTLIIGGEAGDNTAVDRIEVSVDGGPWAEAEGAETWAYEWDSSALGEGWHTIQCRATDVAGNVETSLDSVDVLIDRSPPILTADTPPPRAVPDPEGHWIVQLSGTYSDVNPGPYVEVLLRGQGDVAGNGWQTATIAAGVWNIDYALPTINNEGAAIGEPTGVYTLSLRAADSVGNLNPEAVYNPALSLDNTRPALKVLDPVSPTAVVSTNVVLSGVITDGGTVASGVDLIELNFRQVAGVDAARGALMHLLFEEPAGQRVFADSSGHGHEATCQEGTCPSISFGRIGGGLGFDGVDDVAHVEASEQLNLGAGSGEFTIAAWVWPAASNESITYPFLGYQYPDGRRTPWLGVRHRQNSHYLHIHGGFTDIDGNHHSLEPMMAINGVYEWNWIHFALTFDRQDLVAYVQAPYGSATSRYSFTLSLPTVTRPLSDSLQFDLGHMGSSPYFEGNLDEVMVYDRALAQNEVYALYDAATFPTAVVTPTQAGPGVVTSTWAYTFTSDLEGHYDLYLYGEDVVGNRNTYPFTWQNWRGEVDTRDPWVDIYAYSWSPELFYWQTDVICRAYDISLDEDAFAGCPCEEATWERTYYHEIYPWYSRISSDTQRLYAIEAECDLPGIWFPVLTACDIHDHCATDDDPDWGGDPGTLALRAFTTGTLPLDSRVLTPTQGAVLTALSSFEVAGSAYAESYLQSLTVTVNGAPFYLDGWLPGTITGTIWSSSFVPPAEGKYHFLPRVSDWAGRTQTTTHPSTVIVDLLPPAPPTFDTLVITTAHRANQGVAVLGGQALDSVEVARVEVSANNVGWDRAALDGTAWQFLWPIGSDDPDGVSYDVSVRATDWAGRTGQTDATLLFDMAPPAPVTLTLGYLDWFNAYHPLEPGQVVTDGNLLVLEWTPSSDGSGLLGYRVGWTASPTDTAGTLFVPAGTIYSVTQPISEAQAIYAHVVGIDLLGNRRHQARGPVYVDAPTTPDLISDLAYHGWMDSGCAQQGLDRRIPAHAPDYAALSAPQRLYATWDDTFLRLAWVGANWDGDGDLFVYLDTQAGAGATQLYDPYAAMPTGTAIYLPGNLPPPPDTSDWPDFERARYTRAITPLLGLAMQADYLVWVEDGDRAVLLSWTGSDWITETVLGPARYRLHNGLTDLLLPFDQLGIGDPALSPLALLAVASEEEVLRLWSVLPDRNPVDSARAVGPLAGTAREHVFVLPQAYVWPTLGPGVCPYFLIWPQPPTEIGFVDTDLRANLRVEPLGTTYALLGDDLFMRWRTLFQEQGIKSQGFDFLDHGHLPLGPGQTITYTLEVANAGTSTAEGVQAFLSSYYALHLPDSTRDEPGYCEHLLLDVGDVAPGTTATLAFTGTVEAANNWRYQRCLDQGVPPEVCRPLLEWAALDGLVFDRRFPLTLTAGVPTQPPLEWVWADHDVDVTAPYLVGIEAPWATVRAGDNLIQGYASDPSGVPLVEVEVRDGAGLTSTLVCPDALPHDGQWSCPWTVAGSDGDVFELRARASDGLGHVGDWTAPWWTVVVDAAPPDFGLDDGVLEALQDRWVGPEGFVLTGVLTENHSGGTLRACHTSAGGTTCDEATMLVAAEAPTESALLYDDVPAAPISITAAAYCGGGEIRRTFTVTDDFIVGDVNLGLAAGHTNRGELAVELVSPQGTRVRLVDGALDPFANYDVWLDDAAAGRLHNSAGDIVGAPYFDRPARPDAALSAFNGEPSAGVWTLSLCDLLPPANDGAYHRSRLSLTPQGTALSSTGRWAYGLPTPAGVDGVDQGLSLFAVDGVGNSTPQPMRLSYRLDTVPPVVTITTVVTQAPGIGLQPVLAGQVHDGGDLNGIYVHVNPPDGATFRAAASLDGGDWRYAPRAGQAGRYTYWVEAYDAAGNATVVGSFVVEISGPSRVYLPLVLRNAGPDAPEQQIYLPIVLKGAVGERGIPADQVD